MGLDQYALITTETIDQEVDFKIPENACEIHYWRKHPNLHGWMQDLYYDKGGTKEFNCTPVVLNADDLDRLEAAIKANELPDTCGFFFGTTVGDEKEDDLKFIEKARQAIADGYTVFYDSGGNPMIRVPAKSRGRVYGITTIRRGGQLYFVRCRCSLLCARIDQ